MIKEKICGVYCIKNLVTLKRYIGSSININCRWKEHKRKLKYQKHHSNYLQHAWDKYGEENFEFSIIEIVEDKNLLRLREQYWLDYYKSYTRENGYNIDHKANKSECPECTRKKISKTLTGKYIGEKSYNVVYSEDVIKLIINDLLDDLPYSKIMKKYNIPKHLIINIKNKSSWTHLTKNIIFKDNSLKRESKLSEIQVKLIINDLCNRLNCNEIAKKYNVNRKTISDIKNHKTWKLLTQNIDFPDAINKSIGENNSSAKLTTKQVLEIKDKYKLGIKLKDLAIEYNVKYITIYNIIKGISWKNTIEYSNDKKVV